MPDITWYQGQKPIADSKRVKMSRKATGKDTYLLTLEISNPTKADGGNYRCNAFNNFGESNANISLNFQGKSSSMQQTLGSRWFLRFLFSLCFSRHSDGTTFCRAFFENRKRFFPRLRESSERPTRRSPKPPLYCLLARSSPCQSLESLSQRNVVFPSALFGHAFE